MSNQPEVSSHDRMIEPNEAEETDEAFESESLYSDSTSINSSITRYREENGRLYHSFGQTEHWGPNDERAQEQQDLSHHLWSLSLQGKLYLAPIEKPQNVLDLGTGTGIWAMDMGDAHEQAVVKGIDLSPIQPSWIPPNVKFEIDDYSLEWTDVEKYDLIHARELLGTVPDWPDLYRKIFQALKPGGWVDQSDPGIYYHSDYVNLPPDHPFTKWGELMRMAGIKAGLEFDTAPRIKGWMEDAGFINVTEKVMNWAIGPWPRDLHHRKIGAFNQARMMAGSMDFCSRRFANNLGWSYEEILVYGAQLRTELANPRLLQHQRAYFVYGQKPPLPKME